MENTIIGIIVLGLYPVICKNAPQAAALILGMTKRGPNTKIVKLQNIVANLGETPLDNSRKEPPFAKAKYPNKGIKTAVIYMPKNAIYTELPLSLPQVIDQIILAAPKCIENKAPPNEKMVNIDNFLLSSKYFTSKHVSYFIPWYILLHHLS